MNLQLSRRGDYVLRAALHLARRHGDGYTKIREVAEAMDLPRGYTPQILAMLARAGLAEARAGKAGGYRLTRAPESITVLDVVEAAEGDLAFDRCALRGGPCRWEDVCAFHPTWSAAADAIRASLSISTLAEVAAVDEALAEGTYQSASRHRRKTRRAPAPRV